MAEHPSSLHFTCFFVKVLRLKKSAEMPGYHWLAGESQIQRTRTTRPPIHYPLFTSTLRKLSRHSENTQPHRMRGVRVFHVMPNDVCCARDRRWSPRSETNRSRGWPYRSTHPESCVLSIKPLYPTIWCFYGVEWMSRLTPSKEVWLCSWWSSSRRKAP